MTIDEAKTIKAGAIFTDEEDRPWEFIRLLPNNNFWMRECESDYECEHIRECYTFFE